MKRLLHPSVLLFTLIFLCSTAQAQRTVRMNIERMVSDAAIIIHGTVAKVESKVDPQTSILSTFVTIAVQENFYGAGEPSITLKMIGGKTKRSTLKFSEMPVFKVGEEIFSLFYAPSKYGFTSPVGMGQGKFTVLPDDKTNKHYVRNSINNVRLFSGMENISVVASMPEGKNRETEMGADEFSNTIRSLVTILKK